MQVIFNKLILLNNINLKCIHNAKKILEASNSSLENVVKCVIYLSVCLNKNIINSFLL